MSCKLKLLLIVRMTARRQITAPSTLFYYLQLSDPIVYYLEIYMCVLNLMKLLTPTDGRLCDVEIFLK